jgi:RNA polymerase sigma-70 factor (ECF subfamily)
VSSAPTPDAAIDAAWEEEWRENIYQTALARVRERVHPKSFQVFDYCVLQGVSAREVGRLLGLNAAQVYMAKHRVSSSLKRVVADLEAELARTEG